MVTSGRGVETLNYKIVKFELFKNYLAKILNLI